MGKRELVEINLSDVKPKRQKFLDSERGIPLGVLGIFSGRGGIGKSTYALHIAAQVSKGTLPGEFEGEARKVLIIESEDDTAAQLVPRLIAAGANLDNIVQLVVRVHDNPQASEFDPYGDPIEPDPLEETPTEGDQFSETVPMLNRDLPLIRQMVAKHQPALIIIDPLHGSMSGEIYKAHEVRQQLAPLAKLAERYNMAVIGVMHLNKGAGAAADRLSGSHGFRDLARYHMMFALNPQTKRVVATVEKSNYGDLGSFLFELVSTSVPIEGDEPTNVARVNDLGTTDETAAELLHREHESPTELSDAERFLVEYLSEQPDGTALSSEIKAAAKLEGINKGALDRARDSLCDWGRLGEFQSKTVWKLTDQAAARYPTRDLTPMSGMSGTSGTSGMSVNGAGLPGELFPIAGDPQ